jgi:hypothetical protein
MSNVIMCLSFIMRINLHYLSFIFFALMQRTKNQGLVRFTLKSDVCRLKSIELVLRTQTTWISNAVFTTFQAHRTRPIKSDLE